MLFDDLRIALGAALSRGPLRRAEERKKWWAKVRRLLDEATDPLAFIDWDRADVRCDFAWKGETMYEATEEAASTMLRSATEILRAMEEAKVPKGQLLTVTARLGIPDVLVRPKRECVYGDLVKVAAHPAMIGIAVACIDEHIIYLYRKSNGSRWESACWRMVNLRHLDGTEISEFVLLKHHRERLKRAIDSYDNAKLREALNRL